MDAVVKFRTRYSAAQLHLQNLSGDERSRQSSQQAASLMTWMKSLPPLTQNQKHQYLAVVVSQEQGWETKDRVEIMKCLEDCCRRRRSTQKWGTSLLRIFTPAEWHKWTTQGKSEMVETLDEMLTRVKMLRDQGPWCFRINKVRDVITG